MRDDQSFCLQCGAPVTGPVAPPSKGPPVTLLAIAGSLLTLLLIGGILWARQREPGPKPAPVSVATSATPTPKPAPDKTKSPQETPTASSTRMPLPATMLEGDWVPREGEHPSQGVLHMSQAGESFLGSVGKAYELTLRDARSDDRDYEGTLTLDGEPLEVWAKMSRDGNLLTLVSKEDELPGGKWTYERPFNRMRPEATEETFALARTYLPGLYLQRVLAVHNDDDSNAVLTNFSTVAWAGIERSEIENYNGSERLYDYIAEADGIYRMPHGSPGERQLWLPNDLAVGKQWNDGSYDCEVLAMHEPVDLGFDKFQCLKVKRVNAEVEKEETGYFAPGLGEILAVRGDGSDALRLTSLTDLDSGTNLDKIWRMAEIKTEDSSTP